MTGLLFRLCVRVRHPRPHAVVLGAAIALTLAATGTAAPAPARASTLAEARDVLCEVPGAAAPGRPATELRVALGRLLGEHAYLLMQAMRATAGGAADVAAIDARLDANSDALASAIGGVYGTEAGSSFRTLWQRHVDAAQAYAAAVASGDDAARDAAEADLDRFRRDLDAFLQGANPKLDADEEAHAIKLHLDQLTAFAERDYAAAYRAARAAYAHMFSLGDSIALAIADQDPDAYPDVRIAFSPASALRLTLDRLLGEHLVLAAEAMRAALEEAPNLAAARQALDANTADLAGAVEEVYGPDAGAAFEEVWTAHLTAYLDYIDAVRTSDAARTQAARTTLEAYGRVFGEFLAGANPKLTEEAVADLIAHHTTSLLQMVDEYRAGDYDGAQATVAEAYAHMFTVGDALAAAIAAQDPERFADMADLPRTDAGRPAEAGWRAATLWAAMVALLLGVLAWGRRSGASVRVSSARLK